MLSGQMVVCNKAGILPLKDETIELHLQWILKEGIMESQRISTLIGPVQHLTLNLEPIPPWLQLWKPKIPALAQPYQKRVGEGRRVVGHGITRLSRVGWS